MIYPDSFEQKLGFSRIRELLLEKCIASPGREEASQLHFLTDYKELKRRLDQLSEFIYILDFHDNFPVPVYGEIRQLLKRTAMEGAWMEVQDILILRKSLDSMKNVLVFFKQQDEALFQALRDLLGNAKSYPDIVKQIDSIIDEYGHVRDSASSELASIRRNIRSSQSQIAKKLQTILRQVQKEGWAEDDSALTMRDGRMVIPIKYNDKRKIKGFVHDESATGKTIFIEPAEVVDLNNEIRELEYAERREIVKILTEFTSYLQPFASDLEELCSLLGTLDRIRASALLAKQLKAVVPVVRDESLIEWKKAVHPILFLSHSKEGKEVVPLDMELDSQHRILLISGPNAGGKSVCLKTVGLLQYMLQCGLAVPASENSVFGIFHDVFIDIGDEQSIENDLSTYSSHLMNMKHFVKNAGKRSLILIDEFGAGTEPMLGGAIAEAILEILNQQQCFGVITTHYTNLKHFAASEQGIVNGAMMFDTGKMLP